jgi:hypothetical protein
MVPHIRSIRIVAALFAVVAAGNAHAIPISSGGIYNFSWLSTGGGYTLTGNGTIIAGAFTTNSILLTISLTNNTQTNNPVGTDPTGNNARLTAWGFGINPNATGVSFSDPQGSDGGMIGASMDSIPSLPAIEVCAWGGVNCAGGANGGIFANGNSDVFNLTLTGDFTTSEGSILTSVNIQPLGYKYQTNNGSFEFSCTTPPPGTESSCAGGGPPNRTPEPGSLALLGATLIVGFGVVTRRRKT